MKSKLLAAALFLLIAGFAAVSLPPPDEELEP